MTVRDFMNPQVEERLERSQSLLRMASRLTRTGAWSVELPGLALTLSEEACAIHDMPPDFAPTFDEAASYLAPEGRTTMARAFDACVHQGTPFDIELEFITPRGRRAWVRSIGEAERDASGVIQRVQGALQDISERKRAENETRRLAEQLTTTLESITDAFFTLDHQWRFTFLNREAQRLLERVGVQLIGREFWTEFPATLGSAFEREYRRAMSEHRTVTFEELYTPLNAWFAVRAYPSAQGLAIHFRDITAAREVEQALRDSHATFHQLADNITDVFWIRSPDMLKLHYVSPAFERIWGRSAATLRDDPQRWVDFAHPEDRAGVVAVYATLMAEARSVEAEYRIVWPSGEIRWVCVRGFQVRDGSDTLIRLTGIVTDITERKRAELEISRTNRALKMMSSCNEVLGRAADEQELLDQICRIVVETGGYRMAWVGFAQDDESRSITPMAHAGVECGYLSRFEITWSELEPMGQGPAGQVIRTGRPVVTGEVAENPPVSPRGAFAQQLGYRAVIRLPLRDADRTFGLLGLYAADGIEPGAEELKLLQEMADNLAFGIGSLRAQSERQRIQAAVVKVAASVSAASGTEFFEQLAGNMAEALGAQAALVARLLPGEPLTARTIACVVEGSVTDNFDYALHDTPCASLLAADSCVFPTGAAGQFHHSSWFADLGAQGYAGCRLMRSSGQILGLLFVVFVKPIEHVEFVTSTLQIFAARAASELERQDTDIQVREQAALLDIAHEAIQVLDLDGRIIYWNKGAERLYGWTAADALGQNAVELLEQAVPPSDDARREILANGEYQEERTRRTRDGRDITVELRWTLVRDQAGRPKSILAMNTDITEKKRLESQSLRAQRMESIGTLAGGIAHDLNNVLAPILMSLEMLKDSVTNVNDQYLLTTLEGSAQRGADLVKQVLAFARGVEGQRITVNPLHIMRDLLKVMLDTFPKSLDVRFRPAPDLWTITGDPTQMHQVFLNLCVNARDAMPEGGSLTIGMENVVLDATHAAVHSDAGTGAYVMITVEDTGIGIPVAIRDRICEPFFTTKKIGQGTGLGLSTTLAIVKSHGGFLSLASEVGRGSVFKIYIPANTTEAAADEPVAKNARLPRGNGELVLVVDDEAAIRAVAQRTLEQFGYRVMSAVNGADALTLYTQHRQDVAVVLTDMAMPIMDGPALILALRAMNPDVRIIGSSGLASDTGIGRLIGPVVSFVAKPYTAEALLTLLKRVLSDGRGE